MNPIQNNQDVACFWVCKHSWKGRYKRIFSVGTKGITTYNPNTFEVTNRWAYSDVFNIKCGNQSPAGGNEFILTMRKEKKSDTMKFSSEHRSLILTEAFRFRKEFAEKPKESLCYSGFKYHWSETRLPVVLEVTPASIDQLDPTSHKVVASYCYKDIEAVADVEHCPGGFVIVCGGFSRMHYFILPKAAEMKQKMVEAALTNLGVSIKILKHQFTQEEFVKHRFGNYSDDEFVTSICEFNVYKVQTPRHTDPQRRTLCLSDVCILERDPQTYSICTLRPLSHIFALVRDRENLQLFSIEYIDGQIRTYTTTDRDSLLASLLDGVRASGNRDIHVKMSPTNRGKRLGPLGVHLEEEVESCHLKVLDKLPPKMSFAEAIERFNANTPYSGLLHSVTQDGLFSENKDKLIQSALNALLQKDADASNIPLHELEAQFQALRRLFASKVGFAAFLSIASFREQVGLKVVRALKREDTGVTHAAMDMVCALMHPMHEDYELRQEQLNKSSLLSNTKFLEGLLTMWQKHVNQGTGALVVSAMLDFLTFALCVPYSETTDGKHFDQLLEMVAERGRTLFRLFQHPSLAIVKGAGLVMRAVIEEGEAEVAARMQDLALAEGALPRHLLTALFTEASDSRLITHRQLSRHLVGLWVTGHPTAMGLLKRIMPAGLLNYLDSTDQVPESAVEAEHLNTRDNLKIAQDSASRNKRNPHLVAVEKQFRQVEKHVEKALLHWGAQIGFERKEDPKEKMRERPVVLRKRRERIKSEANWKLFYFQFTRDHAILNLIWNHQTREELRDALETEIRSFSNDRDLSGSSLIAWNHSEFEVQYQCLQDEVRIGDYYLRLLLERKEEDSPIRKSYEFFNDLYHRFLLTTKPQMKCLCLQAMAIVYGSHHEDIGPFSDTKYIVGMLDRCMDRAERDRFVIFINKLINHRRNVKDLLDANGICILVDLLTLAHLHTSRAVVPTATNVIEAGDMKRESEKEWYYNLADKREGPVSYEQLKELWEAGKLTPKTKLWAQGMDGWRALQQVSQLRWTLLAKGSPVLNESELAAQVLEILIKVCQYFPSRDADNAMIRPLPRAKRLLSEALVLPHVVQLLLTFDPLLVERVATLLWEISQDNPMLPQLYHTGVFFFMLMYNGSNVLPVARFLQLTHMKQAFRSEDVSTSDIMQRSVLGQLLPEAMVSYLENHGAEKFAQIFLGEFDTPEAIWNSEMRRLMMEKLAVHLADFSPRLRSNTRALYQYLAIPAIRFPQLERELFCNIYYLRHLCDTHRYPNWPIKDPIELLKDVLLAWKAEVEKKPPAMSVDDAYEVLGLSRGTAHQESVVRKAYYRLAQQHHPDKNPAGRDRFEAVNKAYEFLCSRSSWTGDGPNPENIVLILQAQSILFHRYADELRPYKYAGYPQLVKTIQLETDDDQLFSKSAPLLVAASELAYHTVHCSALNAEELRRERGLDLLLDALSRCVSVLSESSKASDTAVQVSLHVTRCYGVAAQFQACRDKMVELPQLVRDLTRILYFKSLPRLSAAVVECVSSLAIDSILQMQLLQAGALWHLLSFLFRYDYTLEEGGVERSEEANYQEVCNQLAKLAVRACARLGGYLEGEQETPKNQVTRSTLEILLTPYLARRLSTDKPEDILKLLNSNSQNPYLLWDNGTRAELLDFLETQKQSRRFAADPADPAEQANITASFSYSAHASELRVGDVFLRLYNEQPNFQIDNPKGFAIDLLDFLSSKWKSVSSSSPSASSPNILDEIVMALQSLSNVIINNPGVEIQCIGHFPLLFQILGADGCLNVQHAALEVLACVVRNAECVKDIAASNVLTPLLLILVNVPSCQMQALDTLYSLLTTTKIVKDALAKGAVLYLLDLFCNSNSTTTNGLRERAAELLARMGSDKLVGPKVRLVLAHYLPPAFSDAMRDSPQACVHMFEGVHENPELIWNDETRQRISHIIRQQADELYRAQRSNSSAVWRVPDDAPLSHAQPNEMVVGGVYLRLFIAKPGWVLRRPKEFLSELMTACLTLMEKDKPNVQMLEMATNALVCLLQAQPALADTIPASGHIPRLCNQMSSGIHEPAVHRSAILLLHQLAVSDTCIGAMSQTQCIGPLKQAMQTSHEMVSVGCEALNRLFSTNQDQLVKQALDAGLVPYLLGLLEGRLESAENGAATKAQIVKALKAMGKSILFGERVNSLLQQSSVWSEYRDQRHDLFISSSSNAGYLTAGTPQTAGYLTSGTTKTMPSAPPPIDKEDPTLSPPPLI